MRLLFISVFSVLLGSSSANWDCGIGDRTRALSYMVSMFADREGLNRCCQQHDYEYDSIRRRRDLSFFQQIEIFKRQLRRADDQFCECMDGLGWWTRNVAGRIFCGAVQMYTYLKY